MTRLNWLGAVAAATLMACSGTGGTGGITGTLTVAGAKKGDVSVDLLGPVTRGAVTDDKGAFAFNGLPDGDFVVRASVPGTREGTKVASVTIKGGKSSESPTLAFTTEAPVTISGHVVFSDGSDSSGVVVTAAGPVTQVTTTGASGAFSFAGVPPGGYVLSADVGDTREQHLSVGANAIADLDVGNLTFTPSGRVPGTVTFNGEPAAAVQIMVTGTSLVATSGDEGQFEFVGVPTGAQTLLARVGDAPFFRSATATVTVTRGENAAVELALSDAPLPTGTVSGNLVFETGTNSPAAITITAEGTSLTTHPSLTGDFSFDLPIGNHRITASAPHYASRLLGTVTVTQGQTTWLPAKTLSFFVPVFTNSAGNHVWVDEVFYNESSGPPTHTFQLVSLCDNSQYYAWGGEGGEWDCISYSLRLLNLATAELTPVYFGEVDAPLISPDGKLVAWASSDALWVYTIATRATKAYALPSEDESWRFSFEHFGRSDSYISTDDGVYYWSVNGQGAATGGPAIEFSADSSAVSVARSFYVSSPVPPQNASRVTRVTLADGAMVSTPGPQLLADGGVSLGFGLNMQWYAPNQWTYETTLDDAGVDLRAFTSGATTTVFSAANGSYGSAPVLSQWQTSADGGAQLVVLAAGASAPVTVQGIEGTVSSSNFSGSRAYPFFGGTFGLEDGGSEYRTLLITSATGASTRFEDGLLGYNENTDESALIFGTGSTLDDGGTIYRVWHQVLPPTAPPTMFAETTVGINGTGWLSTGTAFAAISPADGSSGGTLVVETNGAVKSSDESLPGDAYQWSSSALLQRTSGGWKAFIGDTVQTLAVPTTTPVNIACATSYPGASAATVAAFRVDDGRDSFIAVNGTTGATSSFLSSSVGECGTAGPVVAGLGTAELQGQSNGALFFLNTGDTVVWRGGAYDGYDVYPTFVGSAASLIGLMSVTGDGTTIGFGAIK